MKMDGKINVLVQGYVYRPTYRNFIAYLRQVSDGKRPDSKLLGDSMDGGMSRNITDLSAEEAADMLDRYKASDLSV